MTDITPEPYIVVYFDAKGNTCGLRKLNAIGHWEACETAWANAPEGFDTREGDFEVFTLSEFGEYVSKALH